MNTLPSLDQIAVRRTADKGSTFHDYCRRYEPFLHPFRHQPVIMLEIGVQFGCSAGMWLEYFDHAEAQIHGIDVVNCHQSAGLEKDGRWSFHQGDQADEAFLQRFCRQVQEIDIVIDDACHVPHPAAVSFAYLWPFLSAGGVYAIEDVHSWWDKEFQSANLDGPDWIRALFAEINWRGKDYHGKPHPAPYELTYFEKTIDSIQLSKGLVIITKK